MEFGFYKAICIASCGSKKVKYKRGYLIVRYNNKKATQIAWLCNS